MLAEENAGERKNDVDENLTVGATTAYREDPLKNLWCWQIYTTLGGKNAHKKQWDDIRN